MLAQRQIRRQSAGEGTSGPVGGIGADTVGSKGRLFRLAVGAHYAQQVGGFLRRLAGRNVAARDHHMARSHFVQPQRRRLHLRDGGYPHAGEFRRLIHVGSDDRCQGQQLPAHQIDPSLFQ